MKKILEIVVSGKPLRRIKVYRNEHQEYVVKVSDSKDDGYYTTDKQDAIDTAHAIHRRLQKEMA